MSKRSDYNTAYELEKLLSRSIESVTDNIVKQRKLRKEIIKLRRSRKHLEAIPDEVRQWYEETSEEGEEEE